MALDNSAELDALRRLLTDETLRNILLSQNFPSGLGPKPTAEGDSGSIAVDERPRKGAKIGHPDNEITKSVMAPPSHNTEIPSTLPASKPNRITKIAFYGNKLAKAPRRPRTDTSKPKVTGKKLKANQIDPEILSKKSLRPGKQFMSNQITREILSGKAAATTSGPPRSQQSNFNTFMHCAATCSEDIRRRFIIGIDYGTTFTSVSYHASREDDPESLVFPNQIGIIRRWPCDSMKGVNMQVPTESWYSSVPQARALAKGQFENSDSEWESENADGPEVAPKAQNSVRPTDSTLDHEASLEFLWGYQVPYQRFREYSTRNLDRHIERAKLMLVSSKHTVKDRQRLRPQLNRLINAGIIRKFSKREEPDARDAQDIIADFLVPVLRHTHEQLVKFEDFHSNNCSVSFALTVPTIWSSKSSRVLQYALDDAIRVTGFGTLGHGSVDNLFVVSEPEAAAAYLLGNSRDMLPGETFIVMDCGGGTVDGSTYTVTNSYPLRLGREVSRPSGDNCGASYLNQNFEALVFKRLADESYLEDNGDTLESIVKGLLPNFEDFDKRIKDIYKRPSARLKIPGLLGDKRRNLIGSKAKGFEDNYMLLFPEDYEKIFLPLLERTGGVLKIQLDAAISSGRDVKKVFLIGGFGAAPSLRTYLKTFLLEYVTDTKLPYSIDLILSDEQTCVTAVSSGAVLRAMNVENGPERIPHVNYGFLRIQPFDPEFEGHSTAEPEVDELDGELYVAVIEYFMLKATPWKTILSITREEHTELERRKVIGPVHTFEAFECRHAFAIDSPRMLCEEVLYFNDADTESSFPLDHPHNAEAQIAGKIVTDMTFLRDEHKLTPIYPKEDEEDREYQEYENGANEGTKGQVHYEITYDLVVTVEGRNLRYEARYPAGSRGKVLKTGQISIASAFRPGTG